VFKGRVLHEKLPEYYACADVFVLPTQREGCSNAIVEALAMGLPVISSEGSFNDDILNEKNSLRVNPINVNDVAVAIAKLRDDKQLRHGLARGALISAQDLMIEKRAEKILCFINQQIEQ
jgi:glycosyltransferase involved in cell wall biosynthesis